VQSTISYDSDTGDSGNAIWTTTFTYNGLGQLTKTQINDGQPRTVTFTLDETGQIIRRDETRPSQAPAAQVGSPHELWYRFGDREIGYIGNNGGEDATVTGSRNDLQRVAGSGTFRFGGTSGRNNIGFAQALDPINLTEQGSRGGSGYTVRSGDTLESLAQKLYGDAGLWYKIAEVNGLQGGANLIAGQQIQLPSGVTRNTYTDKSYRPYDPAQAMGDLSPSTPKPAKKPSCGLLGQILLAAIAIGVAAWLGPGIMGAFEGLGSVFGTAAGLAATGAVSSIASQAVGVATGIQDKFSWKQVGISAIRTMVGGPPSIGDFITDVAWGAVTEVITQGWLVATGLQHKFDWAGVAAAGVSSGVGGLVGGALDDSSSTTGRKIATAAASTIAYAATRSALTDESFGRNLAAGATNAVAQMLGQRRPGRRLFAGQIWGGGERFVCRQRNLLRKGQSWRSQSADRLGKSGW
jgi:YD repeat-containing protein